MDLNEQTLELPEFETHVGGAAPLSLPDFDDGQVSQDQTLVVEFGRTQLPLATAHQLAIDSLVPLHQQSSQPIVLRSGHKVVAHGELLQVGGKIGIRITELF